MYVEVSGQQWASKDTVRGPGWRAGLREFLGDGVLEHDMVVRQSLVELPLHPTHDHAPLSCAGVAPHTTPARPCVCDPYVHT